jgi:[ribosomal protein S5]-alanine N-acetyltransferase
MQNKSAELIILRESSESDLEIFFENQLDEQAIYMAAFTPKDPTDKEGYITKWKKLLTDDSVNMQTILYNNQIAGSVVKFVTEGEAEITYWLGREFWGKSIATNALKQFLTIEKTRPIFGRVAFDNVVSQKVLEKCSFKKIGEDTYFANARGKEVIEYIYTLKN